MDTTSNRRIDVAFIVDDDEIYQYGIRKLITLRNLCKNLLVFDNGLSALEYLASIVSIPEKIPDVILLDINMPVLDGWGFIDEFVKLKPKIDKKITIYMVSSSINPNDLERASQISEISDYIVKPVNMEQLMKIFNPLEL